MAEEGNKDASATFYKMRSMNRWFLVSAVLLTLSYVWSVMADHEREFKGYQTRFFEVERQLAVKQGRAAFDAAGGLVVVGDGTADHEGRLREEVERLRGMLASDEEKRPELQKKLEEAQFELVTTNARMKQAKANFEADRFIYEELAHELGEHALFEPQSDAAKEALEKYLELKRVYEGLAEDDKRCESERDAARAEVQRFEALSGRRRCRARVEGA